MSDTNGTAAKELTTADLQNMLGQGVQVGEPVPMPAPTNRQKLDQAANAVGNIDQATIEGQLGAMAWDQMILRMKLKAVLETALPLADQADAPKG